MRYVLIAIWASSVGCLYDQGIGEDFVSCAANSECGEKQRCGGMLSSEETCVVDGYLGMDDDGIFPERPLDQDSVFFQCDGGQRHYSYCTAEAQAICDETVGVGFEQMCGKPLDGSAERTYPVALRLGSDDLWQCNPDLTCNDPTTMCVRIFEYDQDGYKSNRRVCVPTGLVSQPPPWLR